MQDGPQNDGEKQAVISGILKQLRSNDPGPAWVEFLDCYSQHIMNAVCQFEFEQDRIDECFLYVCEKLNDDGFRRLLQFNPRGPARFRTWLGAVVFNLCVDWHRQEFGRVRMVPAIAALPAFDQAVYHLVVEQGVDKEGCYQQLHADIPELTRDMVARSAARVISLLTPRQRWQIGVQHRRRLRSMGETPDRLSEEVRDPAADPEAEVQKQQDVDALRRAVDRLPSDQRLLLHLRFQQGLSLKKIAQLRRLGDSARAWRHLQAAIDAVFDLLEDRELRSGRKN